MFYRIGRCPGGSPGSTGGHRGAPGGLYFLAFHIFNPTEGRCRGVTRSYKERKRVTRSYKERKRSTESHDEPRRATENHGEPRRATESHAEPRRATEIVFLYFLDFQIFNPTEGRCRGVTRSHKERKRVTRSHKERKRVTMPDRLRG